MRISTVVLFCLITFNYSFSNLKKRDLFSPVIENTYSILKLYFPQKLDYALETQNVIKSNIDVVINRFKLSDSIVIHAVFTLSKLKETIMRDQINYFAASKSFEDPFYTLYFCLLMNGQHNNVYSSGSVVNELNRYKWIEDDYTFILKYKFEKLPDLTLNIWQQYLIEKYSPIDDLISHLLRPIIFEESLVGSSANQLMTKPAGPVSAPVAIPRNVLSLPKSVPKTVTKEQKTLKKKEKRPYKVIKNSSVPNKSSGRITRKIKKKAARKKKLQPLLDDLILDNLDSRKELFHKTEDGIRRCKSGVEKVRDLRAVVQEYDTKKSNGVQFTEQARAWIVHYPRKCTKCLKNHFNDDVEKFIEKYGKKWKPSEFKCTCAS